MKRVVERELMDDAVELRSELERNLADIAFANRAFGGLTPALREIRRSGSRTLLDVCCGSGDVPLAAVREARRRRTALTVTALDSSEQILAIARERAGADVAVRFVLGDAAALPFNDSAFDIVTCNLALHHFEPDRARIMLRELRRVARLTPFVCDLRRSRLAYAAAYAWSRLGSRNRLTRHDAPLSVRRAYTPHEARTLALAAGWRAPRIKNEPFFRMSMVDAASPCSEPLDG